MNNQKIHSFIVLMAIFGILTSCVTVQDKMLSPEERTSVEVVGRVNTQFLTAQPFHKISENNIARKAYSKLMEEARKNFQGNLEVVNITMDGSYHILTILPLPMGYGIWGNFQTVRASGDVVLYSSAISSGVTQGLADTVIKLSLEIAERMPRDSTIAVLSVFSINRNTSEYIIGELEYNLVNSGRFTIVDRRRLDQIRNELDFQMSGDVSDDSAISIGNMLGANIVITGEISGVGSNQRLILKALDVMTARIIAMAREQL
ncbi:MAG: penicillin-binding protein activator LpoB [Treponema sp.]|nr:penicillin-binding protein activator LpoB [Treponema sp.]